jgi:hypothetical protein
MLYISFSAIRMMAPVVVMPSLQVTSVRSVYSVRSVRSCRINKLGIGTLYGLSISSSTFLFLFTQHHRNPLFMHKYICNITIQSVIFDIPPVEAISFRADWATSFPQAVYCIPEATAGNSP